MNRGPVAQIESLRVEVQNGTPIVDGFSLTIGPGEIVALVGESGSGKTTVALALLGFAARGVRLAGGSVRVVGEEFIGRSDGELRSLRGRLVSYVPQDPASALNPSMRVGNQIAEMLRAHPSARKRGDETTRVLASVHLPSDREFLRRYPHQLSGGQQQRLAIAVALVAQPPLVVLDEPTTGLDVVTQAHILEELQHLRAELGLAMVYVSHDLAVVGALADRVTVMYAGSIVEEGSAQEVFQRPRHPYTRGLVSSIPDHLAPRHVKGIRGVAPGIDERGQGCPFAPRCDQFTDACAAALPALESVGAVHAVRCLRWQETPPITLGRAVTDRAETGEATALLRVEGLTARYRARAGSIVAADNVSFDVGVGEAVALVGESGSGKTTIARCVAGLVRPSAGRILLASMSLAGRARERTREQRRRVQIVFQNPYDSLNPRRSVIDTIARPAVLLRGLGEAAAREEARTLLGDVRLSARLADRLPRELSGGERQRVAIARALAARPDLLVCDEVTSALDVSVQATVLDLLAELRSQLGLALLFISHDLGVVASLCERALVLQHGTIREQGRVADAAADPSGCVHAPADRLGPTAGTCSFRHALNAAELRLSVGIPRRAE